MGKPARDVAKGKHTIALCILMCHEKLQHLKFTICTAYVPITQTPIHSLYLYLYIYYDLLRLIFPILLPSTCIGLYLTT